MPSRGCPSVARRTHLVDKVTGDAGPRMMFVDRFFVWGVQHTIDFVVFFAEQNVVVRDPELVRRRILQIVELVRREWRHGMGIDEPWHGYNLLVRGQWVLVERLQTTLGIVTNTVIA